MVKNELEGFVLFKPRATTGIYVKISKNGVRFSEDVLRIMGNSEWLLLFTDENSQRIMIQPVKKGAANALRLNKGNTFSQRTVIDVIRKLAEMDEGERATIYGHKCSWAANPSVIFNLKQQRKEAKANDTGNNQING